MKESDKRLIVEFCGLSEHLPTDNWLCSCGAEYGTKPALKRHMRIANLDPLDPADMYGKIWPAFEKQQDYLMGGFLSYLQIGKAGKEIDKWAWGTNIISILTSAPDLAQSLLEYIKE